METHAPALSDSLQPPPQEQSSSSSSMQHQESRSPSPAPPSLNFPDAPSNPSSLAPPQDHPWDPETASPGSSITSLGAAAAHGLQIPPYIGSPPLSPSRETSPSRLSTISQLAGSQLQRVASVGRHNRSNSSPMGFTGDKGQPPKVGAAALFSSLFAAKGTGEQEQPAGSASAVGTPRLLPPAVMSGTRSVSGLSTGAPKSGNKGFFNSIGSSLGNAIQTHINSGSPPGSPSRGSHRSSRAITPELSPTMLVDEFAGIPFRTLLNSFLEESAGTPENPDDALKRTPEGRLEELAATAGDLLDRVYEAYRSRTSALSEMLDEQEVTKEVLEESRIKTSEYKMQLGRFANEERIVREEQQVRLSEQEKRIRELEAELQRERAKREEVEEELQRRTTPRGKRTSAASDSGFESDNESMFSRTSQGASPVDSFLDGGVDDRRDPASRCEHCSARVVTSSAASIRNPTPLSQAWSPGSEGSTTPTQAAPAPKWGFASLTRRGTGWSIGSNAEDVRQENRMLRARVGELEAVVNDVLEVVAGRGRGG